MIFHPLYLKGAYLIDLDRHEDERGFFSRLYCEKEFKKHKLASKWAQINDSYSEKKGTLRGLHFQRYPNTEIKLVRCVRGAVWDVIVDLRYQSNTFGNWYGAEINEDNRTMMYVPQGFAHGFITLTDHSEILYLVSNFYNQSLENSLAWNDKDVGIKWPIAPLIISAKDQKNSSLKDVLPFIFDK